MRTGKAQPGRPARDARRAFTLIELLCVCAVVALLTGLLMPALAGAREAGRSAACASNLRQLGLANDTYSNDYRGHYAPAAPDSLANRTRWFGARPSAAVPFDNEGGPLSDYLGGTGGQKVRRCPTFAPSTSPLAFERGCGGYGYNHGYVGVKLRTVSGVWQVDSDRSGAPVSSFPSPTTVIAFADSALFAGQSVGMIEYSFAEPRWWPTEPTNRPDPSLHFRHGSGRSGRAPGEAGVNWLDGHVSVVSRTFTWSSGIYGSPSADTLLGWPGASDDNSLFGAR